MITQSKPTIDIADAEAVCRGILSGQLAQGSVVEQFENEMSRFIGVRYAVATNSGTASLHLALLALGIKEGDEVVLPSFVCTALLNAINYIGATPCLVDINENDYNISAEDVRRKLTGKTKAIIVPHMFGTPANLDELLNLSIPIIEDCAQSIGASYNGKVVGSFGSASIFSFYATKMLATGEGGMILTNLSNVSERVKDLRDYDVKPDYLVRYNYKMTDFQAALGISQLGKLEHFISRRIEIAAQYTASLSDLDVSLPLHPKDKEGVWYRYVIKVKGKLEQVIQRAKEKGVICDRPVYKPLHRYLGLPQKQFLASEKAFKTALSVPIYPSLTDAEVKHIISILKEIC